MSTSTDERPGGWLAHYLSGPEAARVPVTVTVDRLGVHFRAREGPTSWWPHSVVRAGPDPESPTRVRIERGGSSEALVVLQPGFLEALESRSPRAARSADGASGPRKVAVLLVAAVALLGGLYFVALPTMASVVASRVSVDFERELGDGVMEQLLAGATVCDDPVLTRSIQDVVGRLRSGLPDDRYDFRVTIVDDTLVNALAVPGGAIVVYRGLLRTTASPEELAGVLAHEMEHVQLRHGTRALMRQLPLLMGGGSDAAAVLGVMGALSYARADEEEADAEGMRLLVAARIDPHGMISFMDTLGRITGPGSPWLTYVSTHPATDARRSTLAAMADAAPLSAVPLSTDEVAWSDLVQRCR